MKTNSHAQETILGGSAVAALVACWMLAAGPALTQSDGDLFAHIAAGRAILTTGRLPVVNPAWASDVLLAVVHARSGLTGITIAVALLAGSTHALSFATMRRFGVTLRVALPAALTGATLATSHWLARPHAFTLAALAVLLWLLTSPRGQRRWLIVPLFAVWVNLHGGWIFGWLVLAVWTAGDLLDVRSRVPRTPYQPHGERVWRDVATFAVASAATLATPFGIALYKTIWRTLFDASLRATVDEYRPPSWDVPVDALFLATVVIGAVTMLWPLRTSPPRRAASFAMGLATAAALSAGRHIALYALVAWPLLVMHIASHVATRETHGPAMPLRAHRGRGAIAASVAAVSVLLMAWRTAPTTVSTVRFPVAAVAAMQREHAATPVFTTWAWSGYLPYAWADHRAWFDPLRFSPAELRALGHVLDVRANWRDELDRLGVRTILLPRGSPLARALAADAAWSSVYRDNTAVVFRRRAPSVAIDHPD